MKKILNLAMALVTVATAVSCGGNPSGKITIKPYPEAPADATVDNYHGTEIADPYRPLEDDNSVETAAWVEAENEVTGHYLSQIPYRDAIRDRLTALFDYPKEGVPFKKGDYYYMFRNDGLQNQSVLYCQKGLDGEPVVFLDPNKLSEDGTVALSGITFSDDNKLAAYAVSQSGSDWVEIRVMDVESRRPLEDLVKWVKFSNATWSDGGFYYSRYDEPDGSAYSSKNEHQKVYFHKIGDPQSEDRLTYEDKAHPLRYFSADVSDDGRWLFVYASEGTHGTEILYRRVGSDGPFKVLFEGFVNDYEIVECQDDKAWVLTNDGASNFRLIRVSLASPGKIEDILPEGGDLLQWVSSVGGSLFAGYLKNASSQVVQYDMEGRKIREIALPGIGTVSGFGGKKEDLQLFYGFTGFTTPLESYLYDIKEGASRLFNATKVNFDTGDFTSEQVFYTSKDGTRVPMFLVYKKGMARNGANPVYLYAYGGFNISRTPSFSASNILFMEQGGIYALANIRGGGEYGEEWHRAGMLEKKQNVFDDFIAAAEWLIAEKYTSSDKLAIAGGSNGGLLVGACMTQRPDLYAVALPMVGVLDMLRYHKFTIGWGWAVEYGSSDDPGQFRYLLEYSPLHNIEAGACYPATMITTADHDDRVVPAHSFKFGAALQAAQGCGNPVLVRIETKAGHGAGKPISKVIEEQADIWAFTLWNTGNHTLK